MIDILLIDICLLSNSVMKLVREKFQPQVIVLQCGADTLSSDPMTSFNLTHLGISRCVGLILSWNLPTMLLGGGNCHSVTTHLDCKDSFNTECTNIVGACPFRFVQCTEYSDLISFSFLTLLLPRTHDALVILYARLCHAPGSVELTLNHLVSRLFFIVI